jgi:hypothetical protein
MRNDRPHDSQPTRAGGQSVPTAATPVVRLWIVAPTSDLSRR